NFVIPRARLPVGGPVTALFVSGGRIVAATASGVAVYTAIDAAPVVSQLGAASVTSNPDGSELYVLDARGDVHVLDPATGNETRLLPGGGPGRAIAYAQAPNRLFVARADTPALDVYELPNGQRESVPLANARTGTFGSGATALVVVPRTQFLYALVEGRVVVVEVPAAADLVIAGALLGLGLASKWAAAYTLGGVFVLSVGVTALAYERGRPGTGGPLDLLAGRGRGAALLFVSFAVIPLLIYLGSYASWFGGKTAPYGWNLWELTQQMYWYHSSLTAPHCAGSPWWSWPLDLKPVYWYFGASGGGANGYIYDAGNIVLFWAALPAAALIVALAVRARSHSPALPSPAMRAPYLPWIPV